MKKESEVTGDSSCGQEKTTMCSCLSPTIPAATLPHPLLFFSSSKRCLPGQTIFTLTQSFSDFFQSHVLTSLPNLSFQPQFSLKPRLMYQESAQSLYENV